jgi:ParB/RepB/Spo0J family partition protein
MSAVTVEQAFPSIPLSLVDPSPANPRKYFNPDHLKELAASIKEKGVVEPVLLRPRGERYELIAGERRYRAAKMAGLAEIPAIVRDLDDKAAFELMMIENLQRSDLLAVEEGEGYLTMKREFGYDVDAIADKVKKTRATVYARMKLAGALCAKVRELWGKHLEVSDSVMLAIARIPVDEIQVKAFNEVWRGHDGEPMSFRYAVDHITRHYQLELDRAPFDREDTTLLPDAGACTTCEFRTGNQADFQKALFREAGLTGKKPRGADPDICTKPPCFQAKKDAAAKRREQEAVAAGAEVLSSAGAAKIFDTRFQYGSQPSSLKNDAKYLRLADEPREYGKYNTTYRQLLGKKWTPPITIARDPKTGDVVELVLKTDVAKSLKALGVAKPSGSQDSYSVQQRAEAEKRKLERAIEAAIVDEARPRLAKLKLSTAMLRIVTKARCFDVMNYAEGMEAVFKRRGLKYPGWNLRQAAIVKFVDGLSDGEMVLVVAELQFSFRNLEQRCNGEKDLVRQLAELVGVDVAGIEKRMRDEVAEKKRAKIAKEKKAEAKKKSAAKKATTKAASSVKKVPTAEQLATRQLQARFLALIRQFPANQRGQYQRLAKDEGREAAIRAMVKKAAK